MGYRFGTYSTSIYRPTASRYLGDLKSSPASLLRTPSHIRICGNVTACWQCTTLNIQNEASDFPSPKSDSDTPTTWDVVGPPWKLPSTCFPNEQLSPRPFSPHSQWDGIRRRTMELPLYPLTRYPRSVSPWTLFLQSSAWICSASDKIAKFVDDR